MSAQKETTTEMGETLVAAPRIRLIFISVKVGVMSSQKPPGHVTEQAACSMFDPHQRQGRAGRELIWPGTEKTLIKLSWQTVFLMVISAKLDLQ